MPIHICEVTRIQQLTSLVYRLTFSSELIAGKAQPGQFVHIRPSSQLDPLLRRPFSIHDVGLSSASVEILFQVLGPGTRLLSAMRTGECLDSIGPLGRGFSLETGNKHSLVIAGGIGIAPFPLLIKGLIGQRGSVQVMAGWKTRADVAGIETIEGLGVPLEIATEDGSLGFRGLVTDLLAHRLARMASELDRLVLYACGPQAMLVRIAELARGLHVPCQVSLEERMACGIGACYGCAVPARSPSGAAAEYKLVCRDGPVFDIDEVVLS